MGISIIDYFSKQIRFSIANVPSVPIGLFLIWFLTSKVGLWYEYSAGLSLIATTLVNFWTNYALKVIKLERTSDSQTPYQAKEASA